MTEFAATGSEQGALTLEVEALQQELEALKARRSALAELVERERSLREQARDVASRDWELSAARQELHQHERGLADELESLVGDQLALAEQQERRAEKMVATLVERALRVSERERVLSNLRATTRLEETAGAQLYIEAVPERLELKRETLRAVEGLNSKPFIFATNTSSLSITEIAEGSRCPADQKAYPDRAAVVARM